MNKPGRVYVASSWRNAMQPAVIAALRAAGIDHYDFRHPGEGKTGFHWTEVGMPTYALRRDYEVPTVPIDEYLKGIEHPIAQEGFAADFDAMRDCDTCVLVLPCGRSAHLELGWFIGHGRRTAILLDGPDVTPELMYKLADYIAPTLMDLLGWLGVEDAPGRPRRCDLCWRTFSTDKELADHMAVEDDRLYDLGSIS